MGVGVSLVEHGSNGVIWTTTTIVPQLAFLSDVYTAAGPSVQGQYLAWDTGNSRFELFTAEEYAPGATGDWELPTPTTFTEALDRLAFAVRAGETGPIA